VSGAHSESKDREVLAQDNLIVADPAHLFDDLRSRIVIDVLQNRHRESNVGNPRPKGQVRPVGNQDPHPGRELGY
jgi:hypothetical protein